MVDRTIIRGATLHVTILVYWLREVVDPYNYTFDHCVPLVTLTPASKVQGHAGQACSAASGMHLAAHGTDLFHGQ
jgi:hypothetical protein